MAVAKLVAASLTIGTGAAAGDFAPSLTLGGLVGAAFGVAARTLTSDPGIQPAAFVLVGMGTFHGGLAHAPRAGRRPDPGGCAALGGRERGGARGTAAGDRARGRSGVQRTGRARDDRGAPHSERHWMKAADARVPFVSLAEGASWGEVAEVLDRCGVSQVPLVRSGEIIGWVGDRELRRAVLAAAAPTTPG